MLMADMGIPHEAIRVAIADTLQWMFYIKREGSKRAVSEVCRLHGFDRASGDYSLEHL